MSLETLFYVLLGILGYLILVFVYELWRYHTGRIQKELLLNTSGSVKSHSGVASTTPSPPGGPTLTETVKPARKGPGDRSGNQLEKDLKLMGWIK